MKEVSIARVYILESENLLDKVITFLHDEMKIYHLTVFRGIEGFEKGGKLQTSKFLSLSLSLPLVVEFFDVPKQVEKAVKALEKMIENGRIVTFQGNLA